MRGGPGVDTLWVRTANDLYPPGRVNVVAPDLFGDPDEQLTDGPRR